MTATTATLDFCLSEDPDGLEWCHFTASSDYPLAPDIAFKFTTTEILYESGYDDRVVCRGDLTPNPDCSVELGSLSKVLKVVFGLNDIAELRHEARLYTEQLKPLQGKYIPRFYGLFEGSMFGDPSACIVLDYVGKPLLTASPQTLPMSLRLAIVETLAEVHRHGVQHNDFELEHVCCLTDGKEPKLIDFDTATAHDCEIAMDVHPDDDESNMLDFGCSEIFDTCQSLGIWLPGSVRYYDVFVPIAGIERADQLLMYAPSAVDPREALRKAKEVLRALDREIDQREKLPSESHPVSLASAANCPDSPSPPPLLYDKSDIRAWREFTG